MPAAWGQSIPGQLIIPNKYPISGDALLSWVNYIGSVERDKQVKDHSSRNHASIYRVCVAGTLSSRWENRLGDLQVVREEGNGTSEQTLLMGTVRDQAELLGILNTLHELHLPILLIEAVDTELCP